MVQLQIDAAVVQAVGMRAAAAGYAYAAQGRVYVVGVDPVQGVAQGAVRGSEPTPYLTTVWFGDGDRESIDYSSGQCDCPVGLNCKHTVALYVAAMQAVSAAQSPPSWQRALDRVFGPVPTGSDEQLALGVESDAEPVPTRTKAAASMKPALVRVRPLRMGKRGSWVQTGVGWSELLYRGARSSYLSEQAQAVCDLGEMLMRTAGYWGASNGWLPLDQAATIPPWRLLAAVRDSGAVLIEPKRQQPVRVLDEPAEAVIDIAATRGGMRVAARIRLPPGLELVDPAPIGRPTVGVVGRDQAGMLTLVGFERAAPAEWNAFAAQAPVVVPDADRQTFERTMLPRIARRVRWQSGDRSFEPTPPEPPVLVVGVDLQPATTVPQATVSLQWRYPGGPPFPLAAAPRAAVARDPAAERLTVAAVAAALAPPLVDSAGTVRDAVLLGRQVVDFVTQTVPRLQALPHVEVRMAAAAPEFHDLGEPQIHLAVDQGTDWFDLAVELVVGDVRIPAAELIAALAREQDALYRPDGGYVSLDRPELQQLRDLLAEARALIDARGDRLRVSRLQVSWWQELLALGVVDEQERAWTLALQAAATAADVVPPLPSGLQAELRPYQRAGYEWLARLRRAGLGGVLADDMGLGKTLQSLAMILDARQHDPGAGPFLVVAPTSVVPNWAAEAGRFAPALRVVAIDQMAARRGAPLAEVATGADVVVTSYALFRLEYDDYAALAPAGLLLDEAQNVKNHQSRAFALAKQLPAPVKFAVTGTPMENNLGELWAMFALVAPGLLGSAKQFTEHYRGPIERGDAPERLDRLRRRIGPFLLRRTKEQVATDLPGKQEQRIDVTLAPAHRRLYSRQLQRERQRVLGLVDDIDRNRIEVLAALTRLRQLAIDPALVDDAHAGETSAKLDTLLALVEEAASEGHRVLVFSQFTRFLDRIAARLVDQGIGFSRLDGSTRGRGAVVQGFADGTQPVFLISLKAGGTGLNLAMADYCILADPWWNPAAEAQAVDRAHRIGQTRPVVVYRLIATDTIEEKVMALQAKKRELVAGVIGGDGGGGAISAADIRSLLE